MKVFLYDNFMNNDYFEYISKIIIDNKDFPWYSNKIVSENDMIIDDKINHQFCNVFFNEEKLNECYELFTPLFDHLGVKKLIKAKLNLNLYTKDVVEHGYHVDMPWNSSYSKSGITALYYLNTCDGYTAFEDGQKIQSVQNRLIKFPGNLKHTGTSTSNKKCRYVLNINYF